VLGPIPSYESTRGTVERSRSPRPARRPRCARHVPRSRRPRHGRLPRPARRPRRARHRRLPRPACCHVPGVTTSPTSRTLATSCTSRRLWELIYNFCFVWVDQRPCGNSTSFHRLNSFEVPFRHRWVGSAKRHAGSTRRPAGYARGPAEDTRRPAGDTRRPAGRRQQPSGQQPSPAG
jgi:hypothetical protein